MTLAFIVVRRVKRQKKEEAMSVYLIIREHGKLREVASPEIDGIFRKIREGKVVTVEAMGQGGDEPFKGAGYGKESEISLN
jgi:hypothetical protein